MSIRSIRATSFCSICLHYHTALAQMLQKLRWKEAFTPCVSFARNVISVMMSYSCICASVMRSALFAKRLEYAINSKQYLLLPFPFLTCVSFRNYESLVCCGVKH